MYRIIEKFIPKTILVKLYKWLPVPISFKKGIVWLVNRRFLVAVQGIILNDKGEVLLLKHTYRKIPWGLPGGWMDYENPQTALEREVFEETELKIKSEQVLDAIYNGKPHRVDLIIKGRFLGGTFKSSAEVSEYGFFKFGEWPDGMPDVQKKLIQKYLNR